MGCYTVKGNNEKVTIYKSSVFSVEKIEARLIEYGKKEYAQYPEACYVIYKQKRYKTNTGFTQGYEPFFVIVEGWGHKDYGNDGIELKEQGKGVKLIKTSKESYSKEIIDSFNKMFNPDIGKLNILYDCRYDKGLGEQRSLSEIKKDIDDYFRLNGIPTECDLSLNNLNRELIKRLYNDWPSMWMIKYNVYDPKSEKHLFKYTGDPVKNFYCDAIIENIEDKDIPRENGRIDIEKFIEILYQNGGELILWV